MSRLLPRVGPVVAEHPARLAGERTAPHGGPGVGVEQLLLLRRRKVGLLDGEPQGARPHALGAERERGRDLLAGADAAGGEHRGGGDGLGDLGPEHDRADLTGVAAALAALGDDDVDARVLVLQGLVRRAAQRGDLQASVVDVLDDVRRRRAEGVGDEADLRVGQGHLDLREGRCLGPAEQAHPLALLRRKVGHAGSSQDLVGELDVLLRHHRPQHVAELLRVQLVHALVLAGDDDVDAVGLVADVLVDPLAAPPRAARA